MTMTDHFRIANDLRGKRTIRVRQQRVIEALSEEITDARLYLILNGDNEFFEASFNEQKVLAAAMLEARGFKILTK